VVKVIVLLWLGLFASVAAADDKPVLERVLLQQDVLLAQQTLSVKATLASRHLWQQQGLMMTVDISADKAIPSLSLSLTMNRTTDWQGLSLTPEPAVTTDDGQHHYRWQAIVFPKALGVLDLPSLRLLLEGSSGAQKTLSLPSLSVYVRSLPVFAPVESWIGQAADAPNLIPPPKWILVGDLQQHEWQWQVQGLWQNAALIPVVSGQGIAGLQPWLATQSSWRDGHYWTALHVRQPWAATTMGRWQIPAQDFWLFDPQTGKVGHWQVAATSGFAIAAWLWHVILASIALFAVAAFGVILWFVHCRVRRQHYREGIRRAQDAQQLLNWLRAQWQLRADIPLAHQVAALPIAAELITLENQLYARQQLYGHDFNQLRLSLQQVRFSPPCSLRSQ
jgi:hypothetical protein